MTWARVPTCRSARPSIQTCSGCAAIGYAGSIMSKSGVLAPGTEESKRGLQPSCRHADPSGVQEPTTVLPSSQTASPGQFCSVTRRLGRTWTLSWYVPARSTMVAPGDDALTARVMVRNGAAAVPAAESLPPGATTSAFAGTG